jgi:hypothetical protein
MILQAAGQYRFAGKILASRPKFTPACCAA